MLRNRELAVQISHPRSLRHAPVLGSTASSLSPAACPSETDPPVSIRRYSAGKRDKRSEPETEPAGPARRTLRHIAPETIDNGPTPERRSKMAARGRDGRAIGLVDLMYRRLQIGDAEVAAANRWHRDYVTGIIGAVDPEEGRTSTGADAHDVQLSRIAAVARCRAVRMALGFCAEVRLNMLLVEEMSYAAMAQRLFPAQPSGEPRIKAELVFLLGQLVEHYLEADRKVRPVLQARDERG